MRRVIQKNNLTVAERNALVVQNKGLVNRYANIHAGLRNAEYDDLFQVGCLALLNAVERYDASKGITLACYAVPYIRGAILNYLRDKARSIRFSRKSKTNETVFALNTPYDNHEDTDQPDFLATLPSREPIYCPLDIDHVLQHLTNEQKTIFTLYYFDDLNQKEIAEKCGTAIMTVNRKLKTIRNKFAKHY